jgi:hypothetical protein
MKTYVIVLAISLVASACAVPSAVVPSASVVPGTTAVSSVVATSSPTVSARPMAYRVLSGVPGNAVASPDGRWIAAPEPSPTEKTPYQPALLLFSADGMLVKKIAFSGGQWSWLLDSSGIFVALSLPQAPAPLGIIELDGRVTTTEVQQSHATLSRDGKWILAERTEGCCASVTQREIYVSARDGSSARQLVRSAQTVALLGIDPSERVVYRDGNGVARVPLAGDSTEIVATAGDLARTIPGTPSPDGSVMLIRGYEPARWYIFANDRLTPWADTVGNIVEHGNGIAMRDGPNAMWIGPHTLLVRDNSAALFAYDALTSTRVPFGARLVIGDVILARQAGTLLALRGQHAVVIDLVTGAARDTGLDIGNETRGVLSSALPTGGFLLSNAYATYRID